MSRIVLVFLAATLMVPVATSADEKQAASPFETAAVLALEKKQEKKGGKIRALRSVALRMPYAYVLDRDGDLFVFRVTAGGENVAFKANELPFLFGFDEERIDLFRKPVAVLEKVGDGDALAVFDDVLACTHTGQIEAFSLKDPARPTRLGRFGEPTTGRWSNTIVKNGKQAILIGDGVVQFYDMSAPARPKFLQRHKSERRLWCGCVVDDHLYAGAIKLHPNAKETDGIAVLRISNLQNVKEVGFATLSNAPYELHALPGGRLIASLDSDQRVSSSSKSGERISVTINGYAALFDVANPANPNLLKEIANAGGRTSAALTRDGKSFLLCEGLCYSIGDSDLKECFRYFPGGLSTLDGAAYHGSVDGDFAAIAGDRGVMVFRLR